MVISGATYNCNTNIIDETAGESFNASVPQPASSVEYMWEAPSQYVTLTASSSSTTGVNINPLTPNNTQATFTLKARGINTLDSWKTVKTVTIVISNSNPCSYIDGTYTYSNGFSLVTKPLAAYNPTTAYATTININTCSGINITWTQTSGSGSFFFNSNGHQGTLYLNSGQCISFLASGGGTSRNFAFCRTSGGWKMSENKRVDLKVYPNPGSDRLFIDKGELEEGMGYLLDLTGKQVKAIQLEGQVTKMNVSDLARGIYLLRVGEQVKRIHLK